MAKQDDGLFLLEVLIDKVVFVKSPCFSDKDFRTCVNIECQSMEPLEICDDDPGACVAKSGGPFVKNFNSGKSCLFSLKEADINQAMNKFPIKVTVHKSLPCGCLPTKIHLGEAVIDMTKEFVQARKSFLQNPNSVSYQALRDSFRIVGTDGQETGEIVMFLRISCFGKLIITKFQGAGGPPALGSGVEPKTMDRSCNPKRDFQTKDDPCACGASHGAQSDAGRSCRPARDPYNSMPCDDPDDPCYCSGSKPEGKQKMSCRNTDRYCLHVPKGKLTASPCGQESSEEMQQAIVTNTQIINKNLKIRTSQNQFKSNSNLQSKRSSVIFPKLVTKQIKTLHNSDTYKKDMHFGHKQILVCMTLSKIEPCRRTSSTQATASVNKCFQVADISCSRKNHCLPCAIDSEQCSTCTTSTKPRVYENLEEKCNESNQSKMQFENQVYYCGPKQSKGMGKYCTLCPFTKTKRSDSSSLKAASSATAGVQTKKSAGSKVTIKDGDKQSKDTKEEGSKNDMMATVSHIRIGPREPCPVHGKSPCQGPKCIAAMASANSDQAPVKVSTMANPRRGVFELVIRRMNGAPFAKNELMLEWTPPPSKPPPCGVPCPVYCPPTPFRPSKCKLIVCRPPVCKTKCCKKRCKKPCGPIPCPAVPCNSCCKPTCCNKPCRPCKPCPLPPRCKPCEPSPCKAPCSTCCPPCKSSPCLRPCPVGRRRPRKTRSQPKIKAHRKLVSPCCNRSKTCPVVRCRSLPGPCIACCGIPPCPLRKCCSVSPFKSPKCCRSICSICC